MNAILKCPRAIIVGVGGCGCNILNSLYEMGVPADTLAINTDTASLSAIKADYKAFICQAVIAGGTHGDASLGKTCAQAHRQEIENVLKGYDVAIVVTAMGGGTGTGATPVIAEICNGLGISTSCVTVMPFFFEGPRISVAQAGMKRLESVCNNILKIDNDRILTEAPDVAVNRAFGLINNDVAEKINDIVGNLKTMMKDPVDSIDASNITDMQVRFSATGKQ